MNKFLNEGHDAVSRGKKKRKLSTTRQDGPYYAYKPLLKGVPLPVGILIFPMSSAENIF